MFNPSRDQVRQFFFDSWGKFHAGEPLSALETLALQVAHAHPEYHALLEAPQRHLEREYFPEMGETNPFLHLSLHLSILEQLSIDQPPGIAAAYQALLRKHGEPHEAQHVLMECLAESLWRAQRERTTPDASAYLACLRQKAGIDDSRTPA